MGIIVCEDRLDDGYRRNFVCELHLAQMNRNLIFPEVKGAEEIFDVADVEVV